MRWSKEFPHAAIIGLDINAFSGLRHLGNISCFQGSQSDVELLNLLTATGGGWDIIIDDGSHRPYHQVASFKALWPHIREGGCYVVEDMHMQGKWRWKLWNLFMPNLYRIALRMAKSQDKPIHETETATRDFSIHFYPHCLVFVKQKSIMQSVVRDY